jgi:hypothetical protein
LIEAPTYPAAAMLPYSLDECLGMAASQGDQRTNRSKQVTHSRIRIRLKLPRDDAVDGGRIDAWESTLSSK